MANTINVNQNNNNVSLEDNNRKITVINNNTGTSIEVTQPITSVVTVGAIGPQGPQGPIGPPGNVDEIFRILTGSVTASVNSDSTIFLINSGSSEFFTINNQGSTIISSNAENVFLIKNISNTPILTISQSGDMTINGLLILSTQSIELNTLAPNGGIYFTSSSFFIGLD
jgi:hypothetical protein